MNTHYSTVGNSVGSSSRNRRLASSTTIWSVFALTTILWFSINLGIPEQASAQSAALIQAAAENEQSQPCTFKRSPTQTHEEITSSEELQYVRLSDLIGEGNTQYTYIPARYDHDKLHYYLRQARQMLTLETNTRVDVVVYLNAEGTITHINYIGEQIVKNNAIAKSACDAVKKCTFTPAYRNNKPVHSVVVIPVRFL